MVPVTVALRLRPGEQYCCRWCGAESAMEPGKFRVAAFATAYLFIFLSVGAYLVFRSLGAAVLVLMIWAAVSPFVYSGWISLRLPSRNPSHKDVAPQEQSREVVPREGGAA